MAVAEPRALKKSGRGRLWQSVIGVAISVAFLIWALWGIKPAEVLHHVHQAHTGWFILSVVLATATFPLRAFRWRIFLQSSTDNRRLKPYWDAVAIGFMANNVLPARAGEVVRAYAGTELIGVPFSSSLASIGVERIFDGVILVFLLAMAVSSPGFPTGAVVGRTSIASLTTTMATAFAIALLVLILLVRFRTWALPRADRFIQRLLPVRLAGSVLRVLENLVTGLGVLQSWHDIARVLIWSLALWGTNAAAFYCGFLAFDIVTTPGAAFVLQSVVAFGVAIPSAPGFFGVFEKISMSVLGIYDVPRTAAFSMSIATHIGWFLPITIIGLVILARSGLTLHQLRGGQRSAAP